MNYKKFFCFLIYLLPLIYLVHNAEEWVLFKIRLDQIVSLIPDFIGRIYLYDSNNILVIFRNALIVASVLPFAILPFLAGRINYFKIKLLNIIAFVTILNAGSHIFSSIVLGFVSPGLYTSIFLLIPYSTMVISIANKIIKIPKGSYIIMIITAVPVYFFAIALSWLIGIAAT